MAKRAGRGKWFGGNILWRGARFVLLLAAIFLGSANWFVHQTRDWRDGFSRGWPAWLQLLVAQAGNAFADYTDALGLTGSDATVALPVFSSPSPFAFGGEPQPRPRGNAPRDIVVLRRQAFIIGWSPSLRHAAWVAYRIPPADKPFSLARPSGFTVDPTAPRAPRPGDYNRSGYDRGHLVPNHAIASRFGREAQRETFMMSNVAPQRPWLNQGPWADIERRAADDWPDRYGEVWVISGTILPADPKAKKLAGSINIPVAFYQITAAVHRERLRVCAVVMPQNISRRARPRAHLVSVREIEKLSGFDFFAALPDSEEEKIETMTPTRLWPSGLRGMIAIVRQRHGAYPGAQPQQ